MSASHLSSSQRVTTLRVVRGEPGVGQQIAEYRVPFEEGMTLLEALLQVREREDPSLAVRYSCQANACKECSALINGKPGYLCTARAEANTTAEVGPLPKRRWIRDLVVDLN